MRGVILAGGQGTRLNPITEIVNKHLLPVYDRPMILHPLETLLRAGIDDILIVSTPDAAGAFCKFLKDGSQFGAHLTFRVQDGFGGIAEALSLAENFAQGEPIAVVLGDNIFVDDFSEAVSNFDHGACLFLKEMEDTGRFGVAEVENGKIINLLEKPENPPSNLAATGFYLYDNQLFDLIRQIEPSHRNELEITDLNYLYMQRDQLTYVEVKGDWVDAGTFESLYQANTVARKKLLARLDDYNKDRLLKGLKIENFQPVEVKVKQ